MPQPKAVTTAHDALLDTLRASEARIQAELASITDDLRVGRLGRRDARLRELLSSVNAEMASVEGQVRSWLDTVPAQVWTAGAVDTGLVASTLVPSLNREALDALIERSWNDILGATRNVNPAAKAWWREAVSAQTRAAIVEGQTPQQAARALARAAPGAIGSNGQPLGLRVVTYANGANHGLADYSGMVMRTTTAQSYNVGAVAAFDQTGVGWVEVFDGADCGLTSHDDPEKPNGRVYPVSAARDYPISHPNCIRSFGARLDVSNADEAATAESFVTPEAAADQARFERERVRQQQVAATRRQRAERPTRIRSSRTPR